MTLLEEIGEKVRKLPLEKQLEVLDFASFLQSREAAEPSGDGARRGRIAMLLARLGELKTFDDIPDPIDWQRSLRKDRHLPGREP